MSADVPPASLTFRPFPTLFQCVDRDPQTKSEQRQEIHLRTKRPTCALSVKGPAENELRRTIMFGSHPPEPMVEKRRLPDTSPGNNCDEIYLWICPGGVQESDILLSTKNISSSNG